MLLLLALFAVLYRSIFNLFTYFTEPIQNNVIKSIFNVTSTSQF